MNAATAITLAMTAGVVVCGSVWLRSLARNQRRWERERVASLDGIRAGWATLILAGGLVGTAAGRGHWGDVVPLTVLAGLLLLNLHLQQRNFYRRLGHALLAERAGPADDKPAGGGDLAAVALADQLAAAAAVPGRVPMLVRRRNGEVLQVRCVETSMPGLYVAFAAGSRDPFVLEPMDQLQILAAGSPTPRILAAIHPSVRFTP